MEQLRNYEQLQEEAISMAKKIIEMEKTHADTVLGLELKIKNLQGEVLKSNVQKSLLSDIIDTMLDKIVDKI
jgi:hypothetical protein